MFWLGAIVSLCYIPGLTGAAIATQWPVLAIVLPFGLLRSGPFTVFHGLGLAFVAYAAARTGYGLAPLDSVYGLWLVVIMGLSVWFGTTLTDTRELYAGLAVGAAVSSAVAVLQYFGWQPVPTFTIIHPAGIYVNSAQQGLVLALVAVALATERMWLWAPPLLPGIVLSGSRGAFVALAVGVLALAVRRVWVFGVVGAAGAFYLLSPLGSSDEMRVLIWNTALHHLTWLGWGTGTFFAIALPQGSTFFYPEYAHNDAIQLAFEYGAAAILPLSILAFAATRTEDREWPVIVAFVASGCYFMPLWTPVASFAALVCVGRVLRRHGMDGHQRSDRGSGKLSGQHSLATGRSARVPVASHH